MREYKEIDNYKQYKRYSQVTKGKLESPAAGPGRIEPRTGQLSIYDATVAQLCSPGSPSRFKLQDMNIQV